MLSYVYHFSINIFFIKIRNQSYNLLLSSTWRSLFFPCLRRRTSPHFFLRLVLLNWRREVHRRRRPAASPGPRHTVAASLSLSRSDRFSDLSDRYVSLSDFVKRTVAPKWSERAPHARMNAVDVHRLISSSSRICDPTRRD
jgi:hypothetical protein